MKILVIDNDINISGLMKNILGTKANYQAEFAFNGREGLDKVREWHPDLILVDFNMPEVSGVDLCKVMDADQNLRTIPVIMVSAMPITSKEFQEGHDNFQNLSVVKGLLEKPFDFHQLLDKVKSVLGE